MAFRDNLISVWPGENFDDLWGSNHGTPSGAIITSGAKLGTGCFLFDGVNDSINCGAAASLKTAQGTWAFWSYHTETSANCPILQLGDIGWNNNIKISTQINNKLEILGRMGNETYPYRWYGLTANNSIPPNQWNRGVLTQDGIAPKLYVNGALILTVSAGSNLSHWTNHSNYSAKNFYIVAQGGGGGYFGGKLDYVVASGRAWTQGDVTLDYNGGAGKEFLFPLQGSVDGISGADGLAKVLRAIKGDVYGVSSSDTQARVLRRLAGNVQGLSTTEGVARVLRALKGDVAGTSSAEAYVRAIRKLVGSVQGISTVEAELFMRIAMSGVSMKQSKTNGVALKQSGFTDLKIDL